jgi:hypothetical protein
VSGHVPYRQVRRCACRSSRSACSRVASLLNYGGGRAPAEDHIHIVEKYVRARTAGPILLGLRSGITPTVSESASPVRFERGTSPWIYWPGFALFVAVALGVAGGAVQALHAGAYVGAAFAGAFLALYLWQIETSSGAIAPASIAPKHYPRT